MRPVLAAFPILMALMTLLFGTSIVSVFHLDESTVRSLITTAVIASLLIAIASIAWEARARNVVTSALNNIIGVVALIGFAFDVVTTVVGAEMILRGEGSMTSLTICFAVAFATFLFAVTMTFETGFTGVFFPTWIYTPLFVVAAIFDVLASTYGFYVLFHVSQPISLQMAFLVFASILVFACQFVVLKVYVRGASLFALPTPAETADVVGSAEVDASGAATSGPAASAVAATTPNPGAPVPPAPETPSTN